MHQVQDVSAELRLRSVSKRSDVMHFLAERQQRFAHQLEVLPSATAESRQSFGQRHNAIAAHRTVENVPPSPFQNGARSLLIGNRHSAQLDDNLAVVGDTGDLSGNIQDGRGIRQAS